MKILLSQDIWAPKLKVKMPESQLEKETLLEILENRLKLDKYVRLFNERRFILSQLAKVDELADKAFSDQCTSANPRVPLIPEIKQIMLDAYYGKEIYCQ